MRRDVNARRAKTSREKITVCLSGEVAKLARRPISNVMGEDAQFVQHDPVHGKDQMVNVKMIDEKKPPNKPVRTH